MTAMTTAMVWTVKYADSTRAGSSDSDLEFGGNLGLEGNLGLGGNLELGGHPKLCNIINFGSSFASLSIKTSRFAALRIPFCQSSRSPFRKKPQFLIK